MKCGVGVSFGVRGSGTYMCGGRKATEDTSDTMRKPVMEWVTHGVW